LHERDISAAPITKPADRAEDLNAEAAWSLADDALARALQEAAALTHILECARDIDPAVVGCAEIVAQAINGTAGKRELELEGAIGAITAYDPLVHHGDDPCLAPGARIRIRKPTVVQGRLTWRRILRKAEIENA
jgi:hypothetical protein